MAQRTGSPATARGADKALAEAAGLHQAGKLAQAEKAYRRILRRRPGDPRALYCLGIAVHQRRRPREAVRHFRAALAGDAANPDIHRHLGLALKDLGRPAAAERAYRDALAVAPESPQILANLATVLKAQGRHDEALPALEQAAALAPDSPAVLSACGHALREAGRLDEAEDRYRSALAERPDHAPSLTGLAAALWRKGQDEAAARTAREAIAQAPQLPQPHLMLGNALRRLRQPQEAMAAFRAAAETAPEDPAPRIGLAEAGQDAGALEIALDAGRHALALGPDSETAHTVHGQTLYALRAAGCAERAQQEAAAWLQTHPDSATAQHLAPPLMDAPPPERASAPYVRATFDAFAESFDERLGALGYDGPQVVAERLRAARPDGADTLLDIGCGTGLVGPAVRGLVQRLEGLDLSPAMLARAAERNVYDALHEADAEAFLAAGDPGWDVVIAADVLIYFGDLAPLAAAVAGALRTDGLFIATTEEADGGTWELQPSGRYRHARGYLTGVLAGAGLIVEQIDRIVLRHEGARPVEALALIARRPLDQHAPAPETT
ncbi:tetratricopeptide repeat protein [uncultured Thiohalocapsa sp.]|uniref:tetratricopeptide repeat protein n=1 Tax=uncultured Thiohalocapsa sp. TaxID=768990 RepID=UPI0025DD3C35|nr:tetratricopeptide repeat protein [uncultured Thiohalocapsa sp.]